MPRMRRKAVRMDVPHRHFIKLHSTPRMLVPPGRCSVVPPQWRNQGRDRIGDVPQCHPKACHCRYDKGIEYQLSRPAVSSRSEVPKVIKVEDQTENLHHSCQNYKFCSSQPFGLMSYVYTERKSNTRHVCLFGSVMHAYARASTTPTCVR